MKDCSTEKNDWSKNQQHQQTVYDEKQQNKHQKWNVDNTDI